MLDSDSNCMWIVQQSDGAGAEEESDKSRSEVNDDEDDDEDGSGEVLRSPPFFWVNLSLLNFSIFQQLIFDFWWEMQDDDDDDEWRKWGFQIAKLCLEIIVQQCHLN